MTSLPSQPSSEILHPSGTNAPLQPLAENGVPLTYAQAAHHDVQRPRRPGRRRPPDRLRRLHGDTTIQRGTLKEIGAVNIAMDDKQIVLPGAVAQGIFRKRTESRAERIVERINAMDPLKR